MGLFADLFYLPARCVSGENRVVDVLGDILYYHGNLHCLRYIVSLLQILIAINGIMQREQRELKVEA